MKERLVLSKSGLGGIERGSRGGEMGEGAAERVTNCVGIVHQRVVISTLMSA